MKASPGSRRRFCRRSRSSARTGQGPHRRITGRSHFSTSLGIDLFSSNSATSDKRSTVIAAEQSLLPQYHALGSARAKLKATDSASLLIIIPILQCISSRGQTRPLFRRRGNPGRLVRRPSTPSSMATTSPPPSSRGLWAPHPARILQTQSLPHMHPHRYQKSRRRMALGIYDHS